MSTDNSSVTVVTGAGRGIGREIAIAMARRGDRVAAIARTRSSTESTVAEIEKLGGTVFAVEGDVRDPDSISRASEAILDRFDVVHNVIANAGTSGPTVMMHEMKLDDWRDCVATNLDGVFHTFRAFIPALIGRAEGSLVAISSMTGKRPLHGRTPYAASKMGLIGLVRTLAVELGTFGIRVNSVCPGAVDGERIGLVVREQARSQGISEDAARASFTDSSPLRRLVRAQEVAATCAFLCSPAAASITGEDVNVNAGVAMY